jgi:hypothetical protein
MDRVTQPTGQDGNAFLRARNDTVGNLLLERVDASGEFRGDPGMRLL